GEFTITFDANGGVGGGTVIVTEGEMPTLPAAPVREHFIFMGWGNVVPANGNATYKAKWLGDINGDGNVTAVDALIGLKHVTGEATLSEDQLALADVNGDGKITALDALILLQFISGKLTELPYK
ncbi:MAG TPA: dockerin type I domain-containing protein, partial [Oscillospiraceae bacterium]|nr:dockerin type I domain-containing protein [Oscillospiraceae bacterium]